MSGSHCLSRGCSLYGCVIDCFQELLSFFAFEEVLHSREHNPGQAFNRFIRDHHFTVAFGLFMGIPPFFFLFRSISDSRRILDSIIFLAPAPLLSPAGHLVWLGTGPSGALPSEGGGIIAVSTGSGRLFS